MGTTKLIALLCVKKLTNRISFSEVVNEIPFPDVNSNLQRQQKTVRDATKYCCHQHAKHGIVDR